MLKSIHVSILATLLFLTAFAHAQDTGTLTNTEDFNQANNDGAIKNYNNGHQTWNNSNNHWHHAHMHPGGPDPGLMAKSIAEARQAMALDSQAQQMARNTLQGLQSQNQQRNQFDTDTPTIDVQQISQIANQPDPAAAEVLAELASDGYNLAGEAAAISAQGAVATTNSGTAGAAPDVATRSVASTTTNNTTINNGLNGPNALLASKSVSPAAAGANSAPNDKTATNATDKVGTAAARTAMEVSSEHGMAEAQRLMVERNRAAVMQQLGIKAGAAKTPEEAGPIRAKTEDIFQVVHNHYESMRGGGLFYEASLPAVTPQTRENLPEFSKGF